VIETIEIFQRQIKPALDEVIDRSFRVAAERGPPVSREAGEGCGRGLSNGAG
jgi:hypothetical protein